MKSFNYKRLWLPFALVMTSGSVYACAHNNSISERVDQRVQAEKPVEMGGPLAAASHEMIANAKELNSEQKEKLLALHSRMAGEVNSVRQEMGRLKMALFRAMMDPATDSREISKLKFRILELDRGKTNKMLSALEEAQKILGRRSMEDEKYYRALMMEHFGTLSN